MDVAAGRPWWQLTKTARQGFMAGALQAVLGLVQLLAALLGAQVVSDL